MTPQLTIDGLPVTIADMTQQALVNYGAYTSFAVEEGAVRGLGLHLQRLDAEAVELFGEAVGPDVLRARIRTAVGERDQCWVRVSLFAPEIGPRTPDWRGVPKVMVGVFAPAAPMARTLRLTVRTYGREAPHLKHVATFGLIRARRLAREAGFDDALFVGEDGLISEGSLWNIGFLSGDAVVWPRAPMLAGVAQALMEKGLAGVGMAGRTEAVRLDDLGRFDGAFICNSATPACAVTAIGDRDFAVDAERMSRLERALRAAPLEAI